MDLNQATLGLRLIVSAPGEHARFEMPSGAPSRSLHKIATTQPGHTALYFEVNDVDTTFARLSGKSIHFDTPPVDQPWLWREVWLTDPSGNPLCLYHAGTNRRFPPWRIKPEADRATP